MTRSAPLFAILAFGALALMGCADAPAATAKLDATQAAEADAAAAIAKDPATDIESGVRQAQLLRLAGNYDGAVHILSQLMMVAADDGRVVSEYGKTLTAQGRAKDAVPFLTRASELQPGEWSNYSAMGVAFDQLNDAKSAQGAYEHALSLRPNDPTVLNNYALSRMLANDPTMAAKLMERARIAGGETNPQIARNMKLIASLAPPAEQDAAYVVKTPAPVKTAAQPFVALPTSPISQGAPQGAPRPLMPVAQAPLPQPVAQQPQPRIVVMQRVPDDPLAGPVGQRAAKPAVKKTARAVKPVETKPDTQAEAKTADAKSVPAKSAENKPEPKTAAKLEAKPVEKTAAVIPPPLPPLPNDKSPKPVAKLDMKPAAAPAATAEAQTPKVLDEKAKPVVKVAEKKNAVPALRLAAGAY